MAHVDDNGKPARSSARTSLTAVSAAAPCPVCGRDHKCSTGADGLIVCGRSSGEIRGFKYLGQAEGDPQFALYRHDGNSRPPQVGHNGLARTEKPAVNWRRRANRFRKVLTPALAAELAEGLRLPARVLPRFGAGWDGRRGCWTVPE
jgi:hypothetical protein